MTFDFFKPKKYLTPLLVSVPHSGTTIPDTTKALKYLRHLPPEIQLRDVDLFVDELFDFVRKKNIPYVVSRISRYVIDLNRGVMEVDSDSVQGEKNPSGSFRRGLLWQVTTRGEKLLEQPLTREEFLMRISNYYKPYHDILQQELSIIKKLFGKVILLDAHSMPSLGTPEHRDPGEVRADVVPGTQFSRSCGAPLEKWVSDFWGQKGYTVRLNHPYRGGYITQFYGQPEKGIYAFQLELNRKLYMDEDKFKKINAFDKLHQDLVEFVDGLIRSQF